MLKDRRRKSEIRACQSSLDRNKERIKAWLRMQTVRNHRNTRQKLEYRIRDRHRKRMIRKFESVVKTMKVRLEAKQRMQNLRQSYNDENKLAKKMKDKERKQLNRSCDTFTKLRQHGPEYACTVCQRLLYKQSVKSVNKQLLSKFPSDLIEQCISNGVSNYICTTCERHLKTKKLPPMSKANKMELFPIPYELSDFTELESRLIAQNSESSRRKAKGNLRICCKCACGCIRNCSGITKVCNIFGFYTIKTEKKTKLFWPCPSPISDGKT